MKLVPSWPWIEGTMKTSNRRSRHGRSKGGKEGRSRVAGVDEEDHHLLKRARRARRKGN